MALDFLPANAAASVSHLSISRFSLAKAVGNMKLVSLSNDEDRHFPCHVANVLGHFHKDAIGIAEVSARSALMEAAAAPNSRHKDELEKCMAWMEGGRQGSLGTVLHTRFAALGTLYAALLHLQKERPGDPDVQACMKRLKEATTNLGVAIGKCPTPPDGTMSRGAAMGVNMASLAARDCIAECMATLDRDAVFSAIAATVLVEPMTEALQRRQPGVLQQIRNGGDVSKLLPQVLLKGEMDATAADIEYLLSASSKDDAQAALLAALKLPDFIAEGDPGKSGSQADKEKGVSDLPPGLRELAGDGKNVAVNYNDFGKMGNKSKVDGANAARLAELDVDRYRLTIDGMLKAFELGLKGSRGCGHLITGIHNIGSNASSVASDPIQIRSMASANNQTDDIDNNLQNRYGVRGEVHQGTVNELNGNDDALGTLLPPPDAVVADRVNPSANADGNVNPDAQVNGDFLVGDDVELDDLDGPVDLDSLKRVNPRGEENPMGDLKPLDADIDLQKRLDSLRKRGQDEGDAYVRTEEEAGRQSNELQRSADPSDNGAELPDDGQELLKEMKAIDRDYRAWLRSGQDKPLQIPRAAIRDRINGFENRSKGAQSPSKTNVIGNPIVNPTRSTLQSDDDASSVSSISSLLFSGRRARDVQDRDDVNRDAPQQVAVGKKLDLREAVGAYFTSVNMGQKDRIENNLRERDVMRRDPSFAFKNPDNRTFMRVAASRQELDSGALISPSDFVKFLKEEGNAGRKVVQEEPAAARLDEFAALAQSMRQREAAGESKPHGGFKDELKRIRERDGKTVRMPKTYGRRFADVLKQGEAFDAQQRAQQDLQQEPQRMRANSDRRVDAQVDWPAVKPLQVQQPQQNGPEPDIAVSSPIRKEASVLNRPEMQAFLNSILAPKRADANPAGAPFLSKSAVWNSPLRSPPMVHGLAGTQVHRQAKLDSRGSSAALSDPESNDEVGVEDNLDDEVFERAVGQGASLTQSMGSADRIPPAPPMPDALMGRR